MFSRLFNWKKPEKDNYDELPVPENANWAFLGTDMHSHFIPGIDDGAKTIEDSISLIRSMVNMGYKNIITTPHIMIDYYPNTTAIIESGLELVRKSLVENEIDIRVSAAAEYYIDEYFMQLLDKEPLLTIYKNEVLVEFSMLFEPPMLYDVIFKMQSAGYKPIIAHPERSLFFHGNLRRYNELKDRGCLLQLNMLSISGYYGRNIRDVARELMAKGLYDYCGSDAHHEKHLGLLKDMAGTKVYHTFAGYPFLNSRIFTE